MDAKNSLEIINHDSVSSVLTDNFETFLRETGIFIEISEAVEMYLN